MLTLSPTVRIFLATDPVDMRKTFDGLCAVTRDILRQDPFTGHLFVFCNRRRDRMKILMWDRGGFWLFYKRLERSTFPLPAPGTSEAGSISLDRSGLLMILEGISVDRVEARGYYAPHGTGYQDHRRRGQATLPQGSSHS